MHIYPQEEDVLFHEGKFFRAEWYYNIGGERPAYGYYQDLTPEERARFLALVVYFCDNPPGSFLPPTKYRVEDRENKIYAFKSGADRFFNFTTSGAKVIVTNAYHKQSNKMKKQDLEKLKIAAYYRTDYLKRVKENTYYEN